MRKIFLIVFVFCVLYSHAQHMSVGARSESLSGSDLYCHDIWSVFNNTANLSQIKDIEVGMSVKKDFLLAPPTSFIAFVLPTTKGYFGFCYDYFGYDLYNEQTFGLAFAKQISPIFAMAFKVDYNSKNISEDYGSEKFIGISLDCNIKLNKQLLLSTQLNNQIQLTITKFNGEQKDSYIRTGLAYSFLPTSVASVCIEKNLNHGINIACGFEQTIMKCLSLRCGISTLSRKVGFGVGFEYKSFHFDFGNSYNMYLGYTPQISLSKTF